MMTEPKQPEDHPAPEDAAKSGTQGENGVPDGADALSKGLPTSDREQTETAAHPDKHK